MNKLVGKILKESDYDHILHMIPDLGPKLGAGVNGTAYDYHGEVLKITMNLEDASLSLLLKQKKPRHFANISSIEEIYLNDRQTGVYLIRHEKLEKLTEIEHNILAEFNYLIEYYFGENVNDWDDKQYLTIPNYDPLLVKKLYKEYKKLYADLFNFKLYDIGPNNLGRKKDGTLAAFDAETNISFPDSYKKFPPFHLDTDETNMNVLEAVKYTKKLIGVLHELDNSNSPAMPDVMPNEFSAYMAEATDESMTMEIGAIPNSLDEIVNLTETLVQLEKMVIKEETK